MMLSLTSPARARQDDKAFHDNTVLGSLTPSLHLRAGRSQQSTRASLTKVHAVWSMASAGRNEVWK